ncbi:MULTISPECIES: HXXEE domain-containing protein [Flavobacterium]|uniref:HXXEE domain-containing protein n=1 Tax=Flavobacterium TaxID=237 RepID=UPI001FCC00B9|nr:MULTISPECIES: HXXEE domain-containing protein [Flavobacterium]UOK42211.1 HXXEE domain-containing protein [Flavobacterium enshiense]
MLGQIAPKASGPASSYFLAVNITAFWIMSPTCALLSRKHPFTGLAVYSIILVNTFFHLMPTLSTGSYNAGLVTTILLFIPILAWLLSKCLGTGKHKRRAILYLVLGGLMYHIILTGPMFLALKINIADSIIALSQILNAVILLAFFLWADKKIKLQKD